MDATTLAEWILLVYATWFAGFLISAWLSEKLDDWRPVFLWPAYVVWLIVVLLAVYAIGWYLVILPPRARRRIKDFFVSEWQIMKGDLF